MPVELTRQLIAEINLMGMGFDALGGLYLAYDLLGGKRGPLRTIARATSYVALFFLGYRIVLGVSYAVVAASGMGILLAIEFHLAAAATSHTRPHRMRVVLFGFLRGMVLGLAGMTIAGIRFGAFFGLFTGIALATQYFLGFSPTADYGATSKPSISRHKLLASSLRGLGISLAGVMAGWLATTDGNWLVLGLRLGLGAGAVSVIVSLFSPAIEWWIDSLPERRLGVIGLGLMFFGLLLQSIQYWVVILNVPVQ